MTWFRVDDSFPDHPKLEKIESDPVSHALAVATWTLMGADCARRLTDGFVSPARLEKVIRWPEKLRVKACETLVSAGLWTVTQGGWVFHDWHDYQPTSEKAKAQKARNRERQSRWKEARANASGNALPNASTNGASNAVSDSVANAAPSRPVPSRTPSVVTGNAEPAASDLRDTIRRRWARTYEQARGSTSIAADVESIRALAPVLEANAAQIGETPEALLDAILDAYWAEPWPREHRNRASLANLARQFDRLLGAVRAQPQTRAEPFDPSRHSPTTRDEEREQAAWIADGCPRVRRAS